MRILVAVTPYAESGSSWRARDRVARVARTLMLVVLVSVLGTGCGGGPSLELAEFNAGLERARCERLARCGLVPALSACLAYVRSAEDLSTAGAIEAGKIEYDGRQAHACVEQLAARSCDITDRDARVTPASCEAVYRGSLAGGEPCSIDAECASGTCNLSETCPESGCCMGTCRAARSPGADGDECAKDRDCEGELVCAASKRCQEPAALGRDCQSDRECADGLACVNPLATMPGTCRPLPHLGEPCPYLRCADEQLRCDENGPPTCVVVGLVGAPCPRGLECSPYLECDQGSHVCQERPSLGLPCSGTCQADSYCERDANDAGTCVAPKPNGELCEFNAECASFYCFVGPVFASCTEPPACF